MANNQNGRNKNPAMNDLEIEQYVRTFLNQYDSHQTNEQRKELVSRYRNDILKNQDMKKVNRFIAERVAQLKRNGRVDPDALKIYMVPNSARKSINLNKNGSEAYSMIIRTPEGKFFFAKSLIQQKNYKHKQILQTMGAQPTPKQKQIWRLTSRVVRTMNYLVKLVMRLSGTKITQEDNSFDKNCKNVAQLIFEYIEEKKPRNSTVQDTAVYDVKLKSTRTNSSVQTERYFQEVFKLVYTHGGRVIGWEGTSECPILPIILNDNFYNNWALRKNSKVWSKFSALQIGGYGFDAILFELFRAYNAPTGNGVHVMYTEPLSKLMNDHYMNLWNLDASIESLAVLVSVTPDSVNHHFGLGSKSMNELVKNNRAFVYESRLETQVMVLSNEFLGTTATGVFINVYELFAPFAVATTSANNAIRDSKRAIKQNPQSISNIRPNALRKIDPLLQSLNRLRFGKTTSNNRINVNNNVRMNYNSNMAPARLFVDMVFREILTKTEDKFDRTKFSIDLRTIHSTFTTPRGVNVQKLKNRMNRTNSNATRAMRNGSNNNNKTMRNVNFTKIKQLIVELRAGLNNLFKINQSGVNLSIRPTISGKFFLNNGLANHQNEWDYVSWFLSNVSLQNGKGSPPIIQLRKIHELVVSAVFALIKKYHAQFVRALLQPIYKNTNNVSTRLHNLNESQKREAVSMCYSVAHAELFARVSEQEGHRTYGDEGDVNGKEKLTLGDKRLPGYSIPAGLMFDCRLPVYDGNPNGVHAAETTPEYGPGGKMGSKDGLPGLMGNDKGNPSGTDYDEQYCNIVNHANGRPDYAFHPIGHRSNAFGNYALLANAKHGKTIADIKRGGISSHPQYPHPAIRNLSMNPDHMIGYTDVSNQDAHHAQTMTKIMTSMYNNRRDVVVQDFMGKKKTSSAAAYLWYDCGDTHAMRVAVEATSKLVSDLKQLGFASYPISGYFAATSPLFEQSVILRQTGMLCAPIFLETLRRRLDKASLNQTEYVNYGDSLTKTSSRLKKTINYVSAHIVVDRNMAERGQASIVTLAEEVCFSPKSIHDMGGIEYRGYTPSFIDSILNGTNQIKNTKIITNSAIDFALSFHNYFLEIYKSLPAYQEKKYKFYLVRGEEKMPHTANEAVEPLDSVESLKKLMKFHYWELRRSFWVSHFINVRIIKNPEDIKNERKMEWNVSQLEDEDSRESLSLLERVLAYWQMYNHADRKTGININNARNDGILDRSGNSKHLHRGLYGSKGNSLNKRLNLEYSMVVEKSKQMKESLKRKFG